MTKTCIECGQPISLARLRILPETVLCRVCREREDVPIMLATHPALAGVLVELSEPDSEQVSACSRMVRT